jgi:hypothetical protein
MQAAGMDHYLRARRFLAYGSVARQLPLATSREVRREFAQRLPLRLVYGRIPVARSSLRRPPRVSAATVIIPVAEAAG